ncbi:MAG: helix-turn-helix domain-containing protein, partial [Candidatus Sulfotelmatobacter sp.]
MSVQAMVWVIEFSESELGARLVLLSIANHAKADGTAAWPSVPTIAHEAKLSERAVRYNLRILERIGEIKTERE